MSTDTSRPQSLDDTDRHRAGSPRLVTVIVAAVLMVAVAVGCFSASSFGTGRMINKVGLRGLGAWSGRVVPSVLVCAARAG